VIPKSKELESGLRHMSGFRQTRVKQCAKITDIALGPVQVERLISANLPVKARAVRVATAEVVGTREGDNLLWGC
jgi:hypothetical protein